MYTDKNTLEKLFDTWTFDRFDNYTKQNEREI